jgi:long-chain acyl-CoA synthetase
MTRRRPPLHYPDQPLHAFLRTAAELVPERVFLRFEAERYTFREMDAWGTAFANALLSRGLEPGDRVLLDMANRAECLMVQHGVSQAGGSCVLVNPSWKAAELSRAIDITRPVGVVADAAVAEVIQSLGDRVPRLRMCVDAPSPEGWLPWWDIVEHAPGTRPAELDVDLSKLEALLPFSSGTTGLSKAVRHSHRTMTAAVTQRVAAYGITDTDKLQYFMALCTTYGVICSLSALAARASFHLFRRFDARAALDNIEQERITVSFGAAPVAIALRDFPDLERYDTTSLRWMMWGATPVRAEIADEVTRRSGIRWMQAYSTTEVGIASNPADDPERFRLDSPGFALSDVELRTVDIETGEDLPAGSPGELVVRSPGLMMGYLPEEDNDGAFLPDGSWRTGDVAYLDEDGWIHLTDRVKELIKVSAFQVAPAEIEDLISTIGGVLDCAVYGVPDARRGERAKAAVVAEPGRGLTEEAIMNFVAERLATYKHLGGVVFVDQIPRNAGGKILRRVLREADPATTAESESFNTDAIKRYIEKFDK